MLLVESPRVQLVHCCDAEKEAELKKRGTTTDVTVSPLASLGYVMGILGRPSIFFLGLYFVTSHSYD